MGRVSGWVGRWGWVGGVGWVGRVGRITNFTNTSEKDPIFRKQKI